ncbi:hypothetical protein GGR50DRAFT_363325 [Xylaria sp. CBS 124048]|nr:hypothetical protein GGR50DRAFT_363325 [Xylaria sp. CBS 124048]
MKRSREPEEEYPTDTSGFVDELRLERQQQVAAAAATEAEIAETTTATQPAAKITELDESAIDTSSDVAMRCSLPPHREMLSFMTYGDYETHYSKSHTNRCVECHKNFPSEHLLNIHFEDCHDAFAAVKRDRGERTYSCFVEGCERKCRTPYKRRNHLIDKHMYPKNYFFALTKDGIDGRHSLLLDEGHRRRRSSTATTASTSKAPERRLSLRRAKPPPSPPKDARKEAGSTTTSLPDSPEKAAPAQVPDVEMDSITSAMGALQFVPMSVRFGRGRGKMGFAKR